MRIPLTILCLIPFLSFAQPNIRQLPGLWVKYKAEMKDGSRIIDRQNSGEQFLAYQFNDSGTGKKGIDPLFDAINMSYSLKKDTITINYQRWVIEKTFPDTLKIRQVSADTDLSQVRVLYFVNVNRARLGYKGAYDAVLHDSVYKATPLLFPQCKEHFDDVLNNLHFNNVSGTLLLHFVVDKNGKVQEYSSIPNDSIPVKLRANIQKAFENSTWTPGMLTYRAVNVGVDIKLSFIQREIDGEKIERLLVSYPFMPVIKQLGNKVNGIGVEASNAFFNTAYDEMKKNHFATAAEYFGQCIEIDEIDLKSYYLRAECYQKLGQLSKAIADWKYLAGLDQVKAKRYLEKYSGK